MVTTGEEMDKRDGVGKSGLLSGGVCSGSQGLIGLVGRGRAVHLGVAMLDGGVLGEEEQEVKVVVDVGEGELMIFDE